MTYQAVVIVFCVMCLGVTMIVVERLRRGHKFPKIVEWRKLPGMRGPRFLI
jgi:hypothetical protein